MMVPFTEQSMFGQIILWIAFFYLISLYPKYMLHKMIGEMEAVVDTLSGYTRDAAEIVKKVAREKGGVRKDPMPEIERMMDFFLIPPVDLDPYGILRKIEHILDRAEDRFDHVASRISPKADRVWRANVNSLLKGTIGLNMLTKMLRHYVEFAKKTGNIQIAMIIHMQLVLIKKIAKAQMEGVKAISKGKPIGDGIGPLVAANLIEGKPRTVAKDVVYSRTDIRGRTVHVLKADGPGATLGKIGEAVKKVAKENRVKKIITIDASVKLEGEETGKVSEGMGAAIGDAGPQKAKIEEAALELGIPVEAIVVKMSVEEAISPLTKNIASSVKKVLAYVRQSAALIEKGGHVLVVGVGNTCGIGNSKAEIRGMRFPEPKEEEEKLGLTDRIIKRLATPPPPRPEDERDERKGQV
ncbi:MAG: DUF1512 domain-containing protein [Methanobacteriota archaeon]|nr:MAG: DUF1512 domain-containing protein [Euryarchaeota archaeon]